MASDDTTTCPPPFISDADYQTGGGYVDGRFCGVNPEVAGQKCCLPCPVQDWVYPAEYVERLKIANYVGISSVALCCFLLLSFLILPSERSNRHYLTISVTFAITFFSIPFVIPLGTTPEMCHDKITPNGQGSDTSCAWTGALLLLGAIGSALWILMRALWLHLRVCWEIDPGRPFMLVSTAIGIVVPVALTAVSLTVTGVSYRTGLVCLPNHRHALVTFWAWEVGFAGLALLVQGVTTGYCVWVYLRVHIRGTRRERGVATIAGNGSAPATPLEHSSFASESTDGTGASSGSTPRRRRQRNTWRKMRRMLLMQWRGIALTLIMAIESLFYIFVFVAQDTRFGEVAGKANEPDAKTWSACLVLTGGSRAACLRYAGRLAISQDLVLGSLLLGSLIGTQNFFLLARTGMFIGWWELLCHPFQHLPRLLHRRNSDLPLTSLNPSDGHHPHPATTRKIIPKPSSHDYATSSTTPLVTSTSPIHRPSTKPPPLLLFNPIRRARSTASNTTSQHSGLDPDMPPVAITNPYKLSLPSERARLARAGEAVDLHALYARDVRDERAAFDAARPATPPPPPLPLSVGSKGPSSPAGGGRGGADEGGRSLATAAAPLSLPSPSPTGAVTHPLPAPAAGPASGPAAGGGGGGGGGAAAAAAASGRPGQAGSRTSTPPIRPQRHIRPPSSSSPTPSAALCPSPSHTPDFLRPAVPAADPGVANWHRLPAWARSSSLTRSGSVGSATSQQQLSASELRGAMRGGLALHPVDVREFGEGVREGGGGGGGLIVSGDDGDGDGDGDVGEEAMDGRRGRRGSG